MINDKYSLNVENRRLSENCVGFTETIYWYYCGLDGYWKRAGKFFNYKGRVCENSVGEFVGGGGFSNYTLYQNFCSDCSVAPPNTPATGSYYEKPIEIEREWVSCWECIKEMILVAIKCRKPSKGKKRKKSKCAKQVSKAIVFCAQTEVSSGGGLFKLANFAMSQDYIPPIILETLKDLTQAGNGFEVEYLIQQLIFGEIIDKSYFDEFDLITLEYIKDSLPIDSIAISDIKLQVETLTIIFNRLVTF